MRKKECVCVSVVSPRVVLFRAKKCTHTHTLSFLFSLSLSLSFVPDGDYTQGALVCVKERAGKSMCVRERSRECVCVGVVLCRVVSDRVAELRSVI